MFTSLLSNLQSLISSRFVVCSFFPCLAFWFLNGAMLFFYNSYFRAYALENANQTAGFATLLISAALVGIAFFAYGEFALLPTIQSLMEGNWPARAIWFFAPAQMRHYERIDRDIEANLRLRATFSTTPGGQTGPQAWRSWLTDARIAGNAQAGNTYTKRDRTARDVARLARLQAQARAILGDDITAAVTGLVLDLRRNNADRAGPDGDYALENTRERLWTLIDYAENYAKAQYRSLVTLRQFSFGPMPLAPTRMGNVAKSVQGYAIDRYNFNFELLWSRLQLLAQKDKDFWPVLQAAKSQLDFLVSCALLTLAWSLGWALFLYFTAGSQLVFLVIALAGPLAAFLWYRVAVAQYRTLADMLRSAVDLFRLDLLTAFHYPQPEGVQSERDLWEAVDALHLLHEIRDLRYVFKKDKD